MKEWCLGSRSPANPGGACDAPAVPWLQAHTRRRWRTAAAANQDFVMGFISQAPAKWPAPTPPGEALPQPMPYSLFPNPLLGAERRR